MAFDNAVSKDFSRQMINLQRMGKLSMDIKKNVMLYRNDYPRLKAKIVYKLRSKYLAIKNGNVQYPALKKNSKAVAISKPILDSIYMTKIVNPSAGIGDQLASWITGRYLATLFGVKYAYSPLYPQKWNDFLGFEESKNTTTGFLLSHGYKKVWLPPFDERNQHEREKVKQIIRAYSDKKVVFFIEITQIYGEQYGIIEDIRPKFHAIHQGKEELIYQPANINIAVHIRRGDIAGEGNVGQPHLKERWLDNAYYISILDALLEQLTGRKLKIYIFSQGSKEEFQEFHKYSSIEFCNDMSAMNSFLHLVKADILITSKSSFSYKPALLSYGIKLCPRNFWHGYPDESDWVLADDDGCFDKRALANILSQRFRL